MTEKGRHDAQRQRAAQRARGWRANWSEGRRKQERDRARERRARARESHQKQSHESAKQGDGGGAQESNPKSSARDPQTGPSASITYFIPADKIPRGDAEEAEQRRQIERERGRRRRV